MSAEAVVSSLVSEGERGVPGRDPGGVEVARARCLARGLFASCVCFVLFWFKVRRA